MNEGMGQATKPNAVSPSFEPVVQVTIREDLTSAYANLSRVEALLDDLQGKIHGPHPEVDCVGPDADPAMLGLADHAQRLTALSHANADRLCALLETLG